MTSFMSKKKKYKFQVDICLEELLEVPFVSAVLFAKLRLDGGGFQDHSSRQEVKDHKVHWDAKFSFPCKMMANASTGVMEKCILRISIRKECKGGRSFNKLGFVDLNLAEYAGAGLIHKKALLEGYDTRHRQDNSMLKFRINLNMISGDILFKAPEPPAKPKPLEGPSTDTRPDDFSSDSLAGSINSVSSSGYCSLTKPRRTPLPNELIISQTLSETGLATASTPFDQSGTDLATPASHVDQPNNSAGSGHAQEPGHSRNSSNTSQMSKASGYSSISHSRQSSSGDSTAGHIRNPSSGSLATSSETGSLDRAKAAYERRKKNPSSADDAGGGAPGRVEITRVNPEDFIAELLKSTNLEQADESAETSGLQLFIAKDGTASLGNHDVKSQMSTFKQVVMDDR